MRKKTKVCIKKKKGICFLRINIENITKFGRFIGTMG